MTECLFRELYSAGFKELLPLIPVDATISEYSHSLYNQPDKALGKIPGKRVSDGWVGFAGWQEYHATEADLDQWCEDGAGICLRGESVVAIDIDVYDDWTSRLIQREIYDLLGIAPTRTGNAPKRLMVFKLAEPGSWPTKKKLPFYLEGDTETEHAIEILGARQQFVLHGIHPKTRRPYTWDADLAAMGIEGLTEVTPAELDAALEVIEGILTMLDCDCHPVSAGGGDSAERDLAGLRCLDNELLARAVEAIPNGEDTDREYFVSMAHACWAASGGTDLGLAVFEEWADRWPGGQADGEVERVYNSVDGSSIGIQWLLDQARANGYNAADDDFGDSADPKSATNTAGEGLGADEVGEEVPPDEDSDDFWGQWVYVNELKRFVNTKTDLFLDKEQFDDTYMTLGDEEKPSKFFLTHRRPHSWADRVTYLPGNDVKVMRRKGLLWLNRWTPGPAHDGRWLADHVDVVDADIAPWLELAEYLIPKDSEREALMDWMAFLLQYPGIKPNWHPLIGSEVHGTGKDSLFAPLVHGLGDNVATIRTGDLEGQWTWWAENVQLVVVSEITSFERRSVMQRLKSYMATPPDTIEINKKGIGQYQVPNRFGMVMFTNSENAAAIEKHDRRFFVLWSHADKLAPSFYERYWAWMGDDDLNGGHHTGLKAVVKWLKQRDLSGFSTRGDAPQTEAKEAMRKAAMPVIDQAIMYGIETEAGPFSCDLVTQNEVAAWLRQEGHKPPGPQVLGITLRSLSCVAFGQVRVSGSERRERLWAVRRQGMYQNESVTRLKLIMQEQRARANGEEGDFEQTG